MDFQEIEARLKAVTVRRRWFNILILANAYLICVSILLTAATKHYAFSYAIDVLTSVWAASALLFIASCLYAIRQRGNNDAPAGHLGLFELEMVIGGTGSAFVVDQFLTLYRHHSTVIASRGSVYDQIGLIAFLILTAVIVSWWYQLIVEIVRPRVASGEDAPTGSATPPPPQ